MVRRHSYLIQTVLTLVPASILFTVVVPDIFLLKKCSPLRQPTEGACSNSPGCCSLQPAAITSSGLRVELSTLSVSTSQTTHIVDSQ